MLASFLFDENETMMGVFLFITKIVVWMLNKFAGASITLVADAPYVMNFLPLILMVIGGTASDKLKKIYR
ncbi:DNA-binding protein [Bacillus wiedmannii]|uniref:DNA-binding protein n=1 Tax=Bacillus wiedmannii TaxID=1890302 RepID=A0A2B5WSG4_9BACI|nr:putative membrane protein [Bacillus wiedmannii]PEK03089.1 DNA-binding protein [Bacillus wiedmannii]PEL84740.1 DNA-binding protein [Bacillus wiedmannii]PEM24169.1 DNA-binding protein [Bacillus wiedmannii]PEM93508.1 DNA-binding protein [Bacillus wiedmannii]